MSSSTPSRALVSLLLEDTASGSHLEFTFATCATVAETKGRLKNAPAPAVPSPSKTLMPIRSCGVNAAERVRAMLLKAAWKGRAVMVVLPLESIRLELMVRREGDLQAGHGGIREIVNV